jgi:hypothetical protein
MILTQPGDSENKTWTYHAIIIHVKKYPEVHIKISVHAARGNTRSGCN